MNLSTSLFDPIVEYSTTVAKLLAVNCRTLSEMTCSGKPRATKMCLRLEGLMIDTNTQTNFKYFFEQLAKDDHTLKLWM